jgi:hypothetical protein
MTAVTAMAVPVSAATKKNYISEPKDSATFLSLTYTELFDILNGDEYYVSIKNTETGEVKTVARRSSDTYVSTTNKKGEVSTSFVVDGVYYTVDDDEETITMDILNVPVQDVSVIDYSNLKFEMADDDSSTKGTVEQFKAGTSTEYYYFNSNNELKKVKIENKKGEETEYEVLAFTDEIPDGLFSTKRGYEVVSAKYALKDTRVMNIFDALLSSSAYTLAFDSNEYSVTLVKDGYNYYSNIVDSTNKTNSKTLALDSTVYTFNDSAKTYAATERKYDDQIPTFFDTSKYQLDGIEKVTENKKDYIVETVSDSTGIYKFYWLDSTLAKIETVNSADKILDTTTFKTFSASADNAALQLPSTYKQEDAQNNISVGEQAEDTSTDLEPVVTTEADTSTEAATTEENTSDEATATNEDTGAEDTTSVTTTTTTTATSSPKTGQAPYALAAIPVALAAAAALVRKKSK